MGKSAKEKKRAEGHCEEQSDEAISPFKQRGCFAGLRPSRNGVVLFIVGPTAVGKSEIALALAKKIGGEIVSCDSMQVYRGMDIGTAKPSKALRRCVRHHLIDVVEPSEPFNAAVYRQKALRALRDIIARHKIPIVVGGTGLYFRALVDGLFEGPGSDAKFRAELERKASTQGPGWLHQELSTCDPRAASKIHPNNIRKIIRALEVYHCAHKPISKFQRQWGSLTPSLSRVAGEGGKRKAGANFPYPFLVIGLEMERGELYRGVNLRVEKMFRMGLKKEVHRLMRRGFEENPIVRQAIGYKEILGWIRGEYDKAKALELVKRNSRRFAKRQFTWFKKDDRIKWIRVDRETEGFTQIVNFVTGLAEKGQDARRPPKPLPRRIESYAAGSG